MILDCDVTYQMPDIQDVALSLGVKLVFLLIRNNRIKAGFDRGDKMS